MDRDLPCLCILQGNVGVYPQILERLFLMISNNCVNFESNPNMSIGALIQDFMIKKKREQRAKNE